MLMRVPSGDAITHPRHGSGKQGVRRIRDAEEGANPPAPTDPPRRLTLGAVTISAHEHRPGADRTSGVAAGRLRLFLVRGGSVRMPPRDGYVEIGDGQGILVTGTASVRMSSVREGEVIAVGMPVDALPELALPRNSAILIEDTALLRPIGAFVHSLYSGESIDVLSREHFAGILRDMILVAIRGAAGGTSAVTAPSLRQRATATLQRRHAEAGLGPAEVAAEMNVSLRQLEREFRPSGRTIRQEIRRIRVAAAVDLLQDEAHAAQTIDAIAAQVGFSNGSSLARAISAEGFAPPSRLRATVRAQRRTGALHT